ncbi:MAG TPA: hypothetical protein VMF61_15175 [Candidatus Acidoferrales bacterium]|nr:hypothetical protein [Candidatus Acidoferrales bacterium]
MSLRRLREKVEVRCPIADVTPRLQAYFSNRRDSDGKTRLQLRVPLDGKGPLAGLALEHDASVTAYLGRDDQNLNDVIRVSWEPSGGAFPSFSGTLVAWSDGDPARAFVEIDGTYRPPGGVSGETFDDAIGHTIAKHTAHALLRDIASAIGS